MPLADDIHDLTRRSEAALGESYDYYTHTKLAWRLLQQFVGAGATFSVRVGATGTVVDQGTLIGLSQHYVTGYLAVSALQQFVGVFEDFFFDLLRLWLTA